MTEGVGRGSPPAVTGRGFLGAEGGGGRMQEFYLFLPKNMLHVPKVNLAFKLSATRYSQSGVF